MEEPISTQYVISIGEVVKFVSLDLVRAKEEYDKLPSGQGKRPGLRRRLVREELLIEDKRE